MADPVTIFIGANGLTTKADPVRVRSEDGLAELPQAVNVNISDSSRVSRRPGYTRKSSVGGHSLSDETDPPLFVSSDGYLSRLNSDFSSDKLAKLEKPDFAKMRYVQVPTGEIYFGNGLDKGYFIPGTDTVHPWITSLEDLSATLADVEQLKVKYFDGDIDFAEYSRGAEDALRDAETFYNSPLPPRHLEFYRGRIYAAYDTFLLYSAPWVFDWFDLADNYIPFDSQTLMVRRTVDGLYVGTQGGVHFLGGTGPDEFTLQKVSREPPVEHTDVRVQGQDVSQEMRGDAVMFTSSEGINLGGPGGSLVDYTKRRIDLPSAMSGAGIAYDGAYLSLLTV